MKPLGALALVTVANGIFTKIWFRSGWHDLHIQPEDTQIIQSSDVASLMDYVQQASVESVDGLAQLLAASPMMTYSAAAVLLANVLMRRAQARKGHDSEAGNGSVSQL